MTVVAYTPNCLSLRLTNLGGPLGSRFSAHGAVMIRFWSHSGTRNGMMQWARNLRDTHVYRRKVWEMPAIGNW